MTVARISQIQSELSDGQGFYLTNLINIRYLTGFTGSNAALLITDTDAWLATDSRYEIQSGVQCSGVDVVIGRNLLELLITNCSAQEIWFEGNHLSVAQLELMEAKLPGHRLISKSGIVEGLRQVKDSSEIELIRNACQISVAALEKTLPQIKVGLTERQVRDILESNMRGLGADDIAFASIVAAGANSAIPHHEPTHAEITIGDLLKIDFGAKLNGYHADCTRTFVIGKPQDWQVEIYEATAVAQAAGRAIISSQVSFVEVESAVTTSLVATGHSEFFTHGLGHGVGLEIHEIPFFGRAQNDKIMVNTVITIEPGVYLRDRGGVRIEDTVIVTEQGYENLTNLPYELIEI